MASFADPTSDSRGQRFNLLPGPSYVLATDNKAMVGCNTIKRLQGLIMCCPEEQYNMYLLGQL